MANMIGKLAPLYQHIASAVNTRNNLMLRDTSHARHWIGEWESRLKRMEQALPSGSGVDSGSLILLDDPGTPVGKRSIGNRLVLQTSFHHMNDAGMYTCWTEHNVIVTPSLQFGIELRVTGRDRNDIKEYLRELFDHALRAEFPDTEFCDIALSY